MIEISEEDLAWLLAIAIREVCIQNDEYGCKPLPKNTERILRLMGGLEVEVPEQSDISWLLDARKEEYT